MKLLVYLFCLSAALSVTGCATIDPYATMEGEGGILVSVVHNSTCEMEALTSSVMKITPVGVRHSESLLIDKSIGEYRFTVYTPLMKKTKQNGFVQFVPMEAGEYWLSGITGMGFNKKFSTVKPLNLGFTVKSGQVTYIGELEMANSECGYRNYKTHNFSHVPFEIRNDMENDLKIINQLSLGFTTRHDVVFQPLVYLESIDSK